MSQLPVQGRIPHQASPLKKNHHLEIGQLNNLIKLALLTSDRLKPSHSGPIIISPESLPKPQDLQALGG